MAWLKRKISTVTDRFQKLAGKSPSAVFLASKLRNQCHRVIAYSMADSPVAADNGELWLLQRLAGTVKNFFDVGANRGEWSDLALEVLGPIEKAILFEPGRSVGQALRDRFAKSPEIEVMQVAVGSAVGETLFFESAESSELSSVWGTGVRNAADSYPVGVTTVEAQFGRIGAPRLDLLKVDTEGNDFFVLQGAESLLRKQSIGVVQFEYGASWVDAGCTLSRAVTYLRSFGYEVFALGPSGLRKFALDEVGEYFGYSNFVAVAESIVPVLTGIPSTAAASPR